MSNHTQLAIDAVRQLFIEEEKLKEVAAALQKVLELHIAHHNHPVHAAARAALRNAGLS